MGMGQGHNAILFVVDFTENASAGNKSVWLLQQLIVLFLLEGHSGSFTVIIPPSSSHVPCSHLEDKEEVAGTCTMPGSRTQWRDDVV